MFFSLSRSYRSFRSAEVPYQPARRVAGVSKFNLKRMTAFACDAIFSFSRLPLRVSAFGGLLLFLGGAGLGLYTLLLALLAP